MPEVISIHDRPAVADEGPKQSTESMETVKLVKEIWEKLKKERKERSDKWDTYEEFLYGKQYKNNNKISTPDEPARQGRDIKVPFNIIRSTVQGIIPIMTDLDPSFDALPRDPTDYQFAIMVNDLLDAWWDKWECQTKLVELITDCLTYDAGVCKVVWNPDLEDGLGDAEMKVIDPRDVWVNDDCSGFSQSQRCKVVVERIVKPVGEWRRIFPDKAHLISPTGKKEDKEKQSTGIQSPVDEVNLYDNSMSTSHKDGDLVEAIEVWMTDETMEEYELAKNGKKEKKLKKKYPLGRHVICIPAKNLTLLDENNPYEDGEFPYARFVDTIRARKFWGEGEIEPLLEMQKLINKMGNSIANHINQMGNPIWLNPVTSGVKNSKFTNQIGMVINYKGDNAPRRDWPQSLNPDYFNFYDKLIQFAESISGLQEISQGRRPQGITAADAINTLQEAAQSRIRLKERNESTSLSRVGTLVVSRFLQFYSEPRVLRVTGKDGWPKFFEFFLQKDEEGVRMRKTAFENRLSPSGELQGFEKSQQSIITDPLKGLIDIKVQTGTAVPLQKQKREARAFKLFESGVYSRKRLLEDLEVQNPEQVLKEVDEELAQQQPPPQGV